MRARVAWLAALAFLGGLVGGAAIVYEGSPVEDALGSGAAVPVRVLVRNVGTHDANVSVSVAEIEGSASGSADFPLSAGDGATRAYILSSGEVLATVQVSWTGTATAAGRGTTRVQSDAGACSGSEDLLITIEVDTTRGVSFPRAAADCL